MGSIDAANNDALNKPAANSRYAYSPARGRRACAASEALARTFKANLRTWKDFFDFLPTAKGLTVNVIESPAEVIGVALNALGYSMNTTSDKELNAELLQDMVLAAVNEGLRSAQELAASKMGGLTGGLDLGGLGLPGF